MTSFKIVALYVACAQFMLVVILARLCLIRYRVGQCENAVIEWLQQIAQFISYRQMLGVNDCEVKSPYTKLYVNYK